MSKKITPQNQYQEPGTLFNFTFWRDEDSPEKTEKIVETIERIPLVIEFIVTLRIT
jgi:hypothetical protein|tara:strand:- start:1671 stop:1838 length:168 start_codon:yes stop_codon:yes gene_type:complete